MVSEREMIIEEIRTAFRNVPRGDVSMHQAHIAKWADDKKREAAGKLDHDKHWSEISDQTIETNSQPIYFDDPYAGDIFCPPI